MSIDPWLSATALAAACICGILYGSRLLSALWAGHAAYTWAEAVFLGMITSVAVALIFLSRW